MFVQVAPLVQSVIEGTRRPEMGQVRLLVWSFAAIDAQLLYAAPSHSVRIISGLMGSSAFLKAFAGA
jgi:hypothetical protein